MTGIGLAPLAAPTARDATGRLPSALAMSPYVVVAPYGILVSSAHTASWNGEPFGASGTVNVSSSPAKYALSWASTSPNGSGSSGRSGPRCPGSSMYSSVSAVPSLVRASGPMGESTRYDTTGGPASTKG